jgi:hypothetical protein
MVGREDNPHPQSHLVNENERRRQFHLLIIINTTPPTISTDTHQTREGISSPHRSYSLPLQSDLEVVSYSLTLCPPRLFSPFLPLPPPLVMSSVKVAVRIRPFNGRERDMNAVLCIAMNGPSTTITNPETKEPKTFAFDFSYWSHDGFHEDENGGLIPDSDKYATQRMVFNDIGQDVLNSAFDGYNSTLFAYGQTGAGQIITHHSRSVMCHTLSFLTPSLPLSLCCR